MTMTLPEISSQERQDHERICSRCKKSKPVTDFSKDRTKSDGLRYECQECSRESCRDYYQRNSVKEKARSVRWRDSHHEQMLVNACHLRARKRSLPCTITVEDIHVSSSCPICGRDLIRTSGRVSDMSPTVDMYDPALGYIPGNIWVICHGCNRRKSDMSGNDLLTFALKCISAFECETALVLKGKHHD